LGGGVLTAIAAAFLGGGVATLPTPEHEGLHGLLLIAGEVADECLGGVHGVCFPLFDVANACCDGVRGVPLWRFDVTNANGGVLGVSLGVVFDTCGGPGMPVVHAASVIKTDVFGVHGEQGTFALMLGQSPDGFCPPLERSGTLIMYFVDENDVHAGNDGLKATFPNPSHD
jgi:hypothetical protein